MPRRLSAVDAVSPALEQTKQQLFRPFRAGRWARLAVVSLVTGEFAGGSGGGGGNFSWPEGRGRSTKELLWLADPPWDRIEEFLPWILVGVVALLAFGLLWTYVASVFRFILFDSVLNDRCELRAGWRRWQPHGSSYFLWVIGFGLTMLAVLGVVIGVPIYLAWRTGIFRHPKEHLALLIAGGAGLLLLFVGLIFMGALVSVIAKDFVVPLMALENLGVLDGWRWLLPMLGVEKMAYTGYVLMKIVLALGSAILLGIVNLLVFLALLVPLAIAGLAIFIIGKLAGLSWNPFTIGAAILLGVVVLAGLLFVVAFVSAPAMVFLQSYTLHFFGSRYAALGALVFRTPPAASGPPTPVPSPVT